MDKCEARVTRTVARAHDVALCHDEWESCNGNMSHSKCHKARFKNVLHKLFQSQANAVMLLTRSNSVTRVAHMHCMLKVPPRRIILLLSSGANLPARQLAAAPSLRKHLKYNTNAFAKDMCRMCNTQYAQTNITSAKHMDTSIWTNADTRKGK